MWEEKYSFDNADWCPGGQAKRGTLECMFIKEGLNVLNWGTMIIWIGYRNDPENSVWQMVNGTDLNFDHHHWGMVNTGGGNAGRKKREAEGLTFTYDPTDSNKMFITIDNTEFIPNGGKDLVIEYDPDIGDPTCVGVSYENDDQDIDNDPDTQFYLQWKEMSCRRAEDTVCEVDFKRTEVCLFGKEQGQQAVTTDKWADDGDGKDPCIDWKRCNQGVIESGSCPDGERFSIEQRNCIDATLVPECDIDECVCNQADPGNAGDINCHYCNGLHMNCINTVGTFVCSCDEGRDWNQEKCDAGRCPTEDDNFILPGPTDLYNPAASPPDECVDYNECLGENDCPAESQCQNYDIEADGIMYTCNCDAGFTNELYNVADGDAPIANGDPPNTVCNDVDECDGSLDGCSLATQCANMPGSYHCGCDTGYTTDAACQGCIQAHLDRLNGNPSLDPFVDAADSNVYTCDADIDVNNFVLDADQTHACCKNIDECFDVTLTLCPTDSVCEDTLGSYTCRCLDSTEWIVEEIDPATGKWYCEDKNECDDQHPDYTKTGDAATDWNVCHDKAVCVNRTPNYECQCEPGWDSCSNPGLGEIPGQCCEDRNECVLDSPCSSFSTCTNLEFSVNDLLTLLNGGVEVKTGYTCECRTGYGPRDDLPDDGSAAYVEDVEGQETGCVDIDECADGIDECDDNSTCDNQSGNYVCFCKNGYSIQGINKNDYYFGDEAASNECVDLDECHADSNGQWNVCDDNASCTNNPGSYTCSCLPGFAGDGWQCADIKECNFPALNDCDMNNDVGDIEALCDELEGSYQCNCPTGYEGDAKSAGTGCTDIDECIDPVATCGVNFACTNLPGTHECACAVGYTDVGGACENVNECDTDGSCQPDTECTDNDGSFECKCKTGFASVSGATTGADELFCVDINECDTNPCDALATCVNERIEDETDPTQLGYVCNCPPGYDGSADNGATCTEIDECADPNANDCDGQATCTNDPPGSFTCTCNPGYVGNGHLGGNGCTEIDECVLGLHDCDQFAECINNVGSFECECLEGFESFDTPAARDGDCTDINECTTAIAEFKHECDPNAKCTNVLPSYVNLGTAASNAAGGGAAGSNAGRRRRDLSLSSADLASIGYNCTCNSGYIGDAFLETATNTLLADLLADGTRTEPGCRELDPCADGLHNCDPNADCATLATGVSYSFECTCKAEYTDESPRDNNGDIIITGLICEDIGKIIIRVINMAATLTMNQVMGLSSKRVSDQRAVIIRPEDIHGE